MKLNLSTLVMVSALAVPAFAQTTATPDTTINDNATSSTGVIVSSTTESLVVRMDDGSRRTFNVTSTTNLPTAQLAEGNRVTVQYRPLDGGLFEAARVELATAIADRPITRSTPDTDRSMMETDTAARARTTATPDLDRDRSMETDAAARARTTTQDRDRVTTDEDAPARTMSAEEEELPATASPMPLVALSGLAALVAGLFLNARRTA